MGMKYFAVAYGEDIEEDRVSLLCVTLTGRKDRITFEVINGAWWGTYFPNTNMMTMSDNGSGEQKPVKMLWSGHLPSGVGDYNNAIAWVQQQI